MLIVTKTTGRVPGALCEVVGETPKRYAVRVVGASTSWGSSPLVQGDYDGKTPYVNKADVRWVGVTREQYDRYVRAFNEHVETIAAVTERAYGAYKVAIAEIFGTE